MERRNLIPHLGKSDLPAQPTHSRWRIFNFKILNYLKLYKYILHCHVSTLQFDYLFDTF